MTSIEAPSASGIRLLLGDPGTLEAALAAQVRRLRARHALAPIDVVVGGVLLRPYLQRLLADGGAGLVNVAI